MDLFKQGMKGPMRPAPAVPGVSLNHYSSVTNWKDDPFGAEVFEPTPSFGQTKKPPPPRPPPPKIYKQPDVPAKPSHFIRKPTVLSSLLSRNKPEKQNATQNFNTEINNEVDAYRIFPKSEPKNAQTGALIDLSSPPSSPTFTTRSSSDGLSVDSFGSDATTSTNHHNAFNGGNSSQAESGFEDDFDLFLNCRKNIQRDNTFDDFTATDPFSPQPLNKPQIKRKPVFSKDMFSVTPSQPAVPLLKGPTIIRAKPARPKPPDNSALLKSTFGNSIPIPTMSLNTTTPIQKVNNGFGDNFESKPLSWDDEGSPERECSPPMPSIPPPPPPADLDELAAWPDDTTDFNGVEDGPYAIALFDYFTDHQEDLNFSTNTRIELIRRENDEWLYGSIRGGAQGLFPSNYVQIKVPLPSDTASSTNLGTALALYDFEPVQPGDLRFATGDTITVMSKLNDEWCFGECNGMKGQFPLNYVQMR